MECTPALDHWHKELVYVCMKGSAPEEKYHSAFVGEDLSNRRKLNAIERSSVERFIASPVEEHIVPVDYGIPRPSTPLQ